MNGFNSRLATAEKIYESEDTEIKFFCDYIREKYRKTKKIYK